MYTSCYHDKLLYEVVVMKEKQKIDFNETVKNLKYTWEYMKKEKKNFVLFSISLIGFATLGIIMPIYSAKLLQSLTGSIYGQLLNAALVIFVIEMGYNIFQFLWSYSSMIVRRNVQLELKSAVAEETMRLETREIDTNNSGVFIDRLKNDTNDLSNIFLQLSDVLTRMVSNIGVLIVVFVINQYIFLFFVSSMLLLYWGERARMRHYFEMDKVQRKLMEKNTGLLSELVRGIRDIKVLNADRNFINKTREYIIEANNKSYEMATLTRRYNFLISFIKDMLDLLFIILMIYLMANNIISIANAIIIYTYSGRAKNLMIYVVEFAEQIAKYNVSATRVFEIIHHNKYEKEVFGKRKLKKVKGDFEFRNVHFSYNDDKQILKGIDFKIHANETVAFVGKSGSGKSTIFSLLARLYKTGDNQIFIDGVDINELDKDSIRDNISIITQNPYIFNFTIRDNLKIVNPKISDKEMIEACKTANLHNFIMSLSDGYDTIVGEGGVSLSGGQRQRLAIARALMKKTEIILFDEATSALDNETQREIQNAIASMKHTYTILIIAHRLSTVVDSDRIIVVDDGKVIAEGKHAELIKTNTFYKNLYETELV